MNDRARVGRASLGIALAWVCGGCGGTEVQVDASVDVSQDDTSQVATRETTPADADTSRVPDDTDPETDVEVDADAIEDIAPWVPPEDPFDRGVIHVTLLLEPLARTLLTQDPTTPVPAMCALDGEAATACHVALTGNTRTFRALDGKASFAVRFDTIVDGLDALTLDAQLDDPSQLRTVAAHLVFRRLGLAAPRATLAQVTLDGEPFGVYAAVESLTSPDFLTRATGTSAGSVFRAISYTDLWPWQVPDLALATGGEDDRAAIEQLSADLERFRIAGLDDAPIPLAEALAGRVQLAPFLAAMAAEVWLGHSDGYPRGVSDYALHVDGAGRVTFLPSHLGASLAIDENPDPWWSGGRLLRHCFEDPACRPEWGKALDLMVKHLDDIAILGAISALGFRARRELADDPRREATLVEIEAAQDALMLTLSSRSEWIRKNLGCTEPSDVDHDGDGFSACIDDCDDDAADVHPGAPEACNLRDDDCDGVLDNDDACPSCLVTSDGNGAHWALCYAPRSWLEARDDCRAQGGELVTIANQETQDALRRATLGLDWASWWIGLNDRDDEGTFTWSDGAPVTNFSAWTGGEPNDSGGREDCVHLTPWSYAAWNDLDCDRQLPYACALP